MPPSSPPEDAASSGSRKRPRLDPDDDGTAAWTRHPNLYMQDGTIVLLAGHTVFRTYGGLLSKHSEVFGGMSSLSSHQPPDAETYDGCPLVRLSDNAEDLGYFLEVLVDFNFFPAGYEAIPFRVVAGVLRLATKYMVRPLRKRAIAHLSRACPTDFNVFVAEKYLDLEIFGSLEGTPHPFDLLSLLRECRVDKLLPPAFVNACHLGLDSLVSGDKFSDKIIRLSEEDTRVAVLGWNQLHTAILLVQIRTSLEIAEKPCDTCSISRIPLVKDALNLFASTPQLAFDFAIDRDSRCSVCAPCIASWRENFQREILKIWDQVPGHFGLADWAQLRKEE